MTKITLLKSMLLAIVIAWSGSAFGQITSAAAGNWSDGATWTGGSVPTSTDNVSIGHAVVVNDASAVCNNLVFTTGSISFNSAVSVLSVYGNSTFGAGITNITAWTSGAKLVFAGTAAQTWTTGTTTRFDAVEINKASGTVTQSTGAIVRIGTSFIVTGGGSFTLPGGNDIEGVQFADGATSTTPTITVGVGSTFNCDVAATAVIRSGTSGTASIGAVTVYGTMNLASTSGNGFRFGAVTVGNGTDAASLNMTTNFGASAVYTFSSLAVNANATFNMNATTLTASTITGDITGTGTVVYGAAASTNHPSLDRSFGGNVTFSGLTRTTTTTAARTIAGNLTVSAGTFTLSSISPNTFTVNGNVAVSGATGKILMSGGDLIINGNLNVTSTGTITSPSLYFSSTAARVMGGTSLGTGTFTVGNGACVRNIYSNTTAASNTQNPVTTQFPFWQTLDLQTGSTWQYAIPSGASGTRYQDVQDSYNGNAILYKTLVLSYLNGTTTASNINTTITNPSIATALSAEISTTSASAVTLSQNITFANTSLLTIPSFTVAQVASANLTTNHNIIFGSQPVTTTGNVSISNVTATSTGTSTLITLNAGALTVGGTLTLGSTTASTTLNNPYILLNNAASSLTVQGLTTLRSCEQTNGNIKFTNSGQTVTFNGGCTTANGNSTAEIFNFNGVSPTINFSGNFNDGAAGTTFSVTGTEVPVINFNNGTSGSPMTTTLANLRGAVTVNGFRTASGNFRTSNATAAAYSMNIAGTLNLGASTSVASNTGGGTNILSGTGTIKLTGSYATQVSGYSANNLQGTGTLHFAGSTLQTIPSGTYANMIIDNATGGATLGGNTTVTNALTLTAGTLATGANNLTLNGSTSGTGLINTATGTLTYGGATEQTLAAANLTSGTVNNLVVNAGSKLTTSGTIAATNLTLNSSASGTATLVDNGTLTATTANVKQYLPSYRSWYMTSPMTGTSTVPVDNNSATPALIKLYNETLGDPAGWTTAAGMKGGTGYILNPGTTSGASTLTFTGTLNNGNVPVDLTRSSVTKAGFNLIGNPYPSHIVWTTDMAASANLLPSIWYRTAVFDVDHNVYSFETYNAAGTIAVPEVATPYIPPMQGFWVRVDDAHSTGQLMFTNAMRYHKDANALKAPAVKNTENQILRLQVTGGNLTDEAVIYFNSNASNTFDRYDSQKMLNGSSSKIHDIYTSAGTEKLVINGLKEIAYDTEIPLHIQVNASNATAFTLKANEISNFDAGTPVYIKNNTTGMQQLISDGSVYDFSRTEIGVEPAFSLLIKAPGTTTSFAKTETDNVQIYVNVNRQIVIKNPNATKNTVASVYNSVGQLLVNQHLTGNVFVMNRAFDAGVYYVKVNGVSCKVIVK